MRRKQKQVFGREVMKKEIVIGEQKIENEKTILYLGSLLNNCTEDITARIAKSK